MGTCVETITLKNSWPGSLPDEMQTLRILWDAANLNPSYHMPLVQDGDRLYRVILQVPGVSWSEPE